MKANVDDRLKLADFQLVGMAKNGDRDAFGELIQRHRRGCVNLAVGILRYRAEAEETQNACWKAFKHLDQFKGEAEFSTWLFRIVENQCLMLIRQKRHTQFVELDDRDPESGSTPIQLAAQDADPEDALGKQEVFQALKTEIRHMPPLLRKVMILRDVEEVPLPDLASQLGITVAAAKSRLLRARLELRERMLRHCTKAGPSTLMTHPGITERVLQERAHLPPS